MTGVVDFSGLIAEFCRSTSYGSKSPSHRIKLFCQTFYNCNGFTDPPGSCKPITGSKETLVVPILVTPAFSSSPLKGLVVGTGGGGGWG